MNVCTSVHFSHSHFCLCLFLQTPSLCVQLPLLLSFMCGIKARLGFEVALIVEIHFSAKICVRRHNAFDAVEVLLHLLLSAFHQPV